MSPADPDRSARGEELPEPRLQLRWEPWTGPSDIGAQWACHYEIVLPLREFDIRREVYADGEQVGERSNLVVALKPPTLRGGSIAPCTGMGEPDTPFRDGAHAQWDARALGNLPIYVIAPDGTARAVALSPDAREGGEHG